MSSEKFKEHQLKRKSIIENRASFKAGSPIILSDGRKLNPLFRYQSGTNLVVIPEIKNIVESDKSTWADFKTRRYAKWLLEQDGLSVKNLGLVTEAIIEEVSSPFIESKEDRFTDGTKTLTKNLISECISETDAERALRKYAISFASLKSLSDSKFTLNNIAYDNGLKIFTDHHENWVMDNSMLGYNPLSLVKIERAILESGSLPDNNFFETEADKIRLSKYFHIYSNLIIDFLASRNNYSTNGH